MEWMVLPLKRYLQFAGRSRRREFWMFLLFQIGAGVVATLIDGMLGYGSVSTIVTPTGFSAHAFNNGPVAALTSLALLIPAFNVTVRRLHDTDRSAWWLLILLVPLLGLIALIIFCLLDSTAGPNRFGADPKQRGSDDLTTVFR